MPNLAALRREIEIISKAINPPAPQRIRHVIVFVDPVTGEPVPDCPTWEVFG